MSNLTLQEQICYDIVKQSKYAINAYDVYKKYIESGNKLNHKTVKRKLDGLVELLVLKSRKYQRRGHGQEVVYYLPKSVIECTCGAMNNE